MDREIVQELIKIAKQNYLVTLGKRAWPTYVTAEIRVRGSHVTVEQKGKVSI